MGLDSRLVGLAVTIALLFDALSDPIVGYWSDHLRSRWGRRHPFMYAAAIPVTLTYLLLWNPPSGWAQRQLFWYLLLMSVLVRTCITFFETPSSAIIAELSTDYDERSSLAGYRLFFGWAGGNVMTVMMFFVIFPAAVTASISNGQFNREAYAIYGTIASTLIFIAVMICAIGTHARIARLAPPPAIERMTLRTIFGELRQTLAGRSFGAVFGASVLGAVATGLSASLAFYFSTYFWGLKPMQIGIIVLGVFVSAALGAAIAPIASRRLGKKRGAMIIGLIAFLGSPLPIVLRLMDVLPANGDPFIFWFVLVTNTLDTALIICFQILTVAMIADLVEQAELRTGRRSEGVFFAAVTFVRKTVLGLGLIAASLVLTQARFPTDARQGEVPADTLWRLGAYYVPTILVLWLGMIAVISTYRIDRAEHEENLRTLGRRRSETATAA